MSIRLKSEKDIEIMRRAAKIAAGSLQKVSRYITSGVTTLELDKIAEDYIRTSGGTPAFLGYNNYPATLCTSINEEIVHGIPSKRKLKDGDIIGVDVGVYKDGFYGDVARTFKVGKISEETKKLMETTRKALYEGIKQSKEGNRLYDISYVIETIASAQNYSVVKDYTGHGIGRNLHESPKIFNYVPSGLRGKGKKIKKGMVFAIEPMLNSGCSETEVNADRWTVVTADRKLSAHFEHTIAVVNGGVEILTEL